MATVNNALLLEKGLRAEFMKAFNNGENPADVMPMIMQTRSTSDSEKYGWLGQSPVMSEWTDERKLKGLLDFNYTLPNKSYEATISVDRDVMEDDQLGAVSVRVQDLAVKARNHVRKLFFDAVVAGTTELAYDGVAYFSASHVEGESGTQSNIEPVTLAGASWTVAELKTAFIDSRARMRGFKDDIGEPWNEGEMDIIIVGSPDSEGVIDELLLANEISSTTNTLKGAARKLISSRLSGNDLYLFNVAGTIKPLIWQTRRDIEFVALEEGERAFMRKQLLFGVDKRDGFGYGLWQKAVKIDVA